MTFWSKWIKAPIVAPLDKQSFRRKLGGYLLCQVAVVGVSFSCYLLGRRAGLIDLELAALLGLLVAELVLITKFQRSHITYARLLDIYPGLPRTNGFWCGSYTYFPLTSLPFLLFLILCNRSESAAIPIPFRKAGWSWATLLLIALSFPFLSAAMFASGRHIPLRSASYFLAPPTIYYVTSLSDEVDSMVKVKRQMDLDSKPAHVMGAIRSAAKVQELSSTGLILALAVEVMSHVQSMKQDRAVSSVPSVEQGLTMLQDVITLLEIRDRSRPEILRYNPAYFLIPSPGIFEIGLISLVESTIELHFVDIFISRIASLIDDLGKRAKGTSGLDQQKLANQIFELRSRFEALPDYRMHQALQSSWFWRIIAKREKK